MSYNFRMSAFEILNMKRVIDTTWPIRLIFLGIATVLLTAIEDKEAAVPWLQFYARAGDENAKRELTRMGRLW